MNPTYAHIRYPNGREDTISLRDVALYGDEKSLNDTVPDNNNSGHSTRESSDNVINIHPANHVVNVPPVNETMEMDESRMDSLDGDVSKRDDVTPVIPTPNEIRRLTRVRHHPEKLNL